MGFPMCASHAVGVSVEQGENSYERRGRELY